MKSNESTYEMKWNSNTGDTSFPRNIYFWVDISYDVTPAPHHSGIQGILLLPDLLHHMPWCTDSNNKPSTTWRELRTNQSLNTSDKEGLGSHFRKFLLRILGKLLILGATDTQVATSSRGYSATVEHCTNRPINSVRRSNRKLCCRSSNSSSNLDKKFS